MATPSNALNDIRPQWPVKGARLSVRGTHPPSGIKDLAGNKPEVTRILEERLPHLGEGVELAPGSYDPFIFEDWHPRVEGDADSVVTFACKDVMDDRLFELVKKAFASKLKNIGATGAERVELLMEARETWLCLDGCNVSLKLKRLDGSVHCAPANLMYVDCSDVDRKELATIFQYGAPDDLQVKHGLPSNPTERVLSVVTDYIRQTAIELGSAFGYQKRG